MRALIVPNTDVISKEALITELETEGQGPPKSSKPVQGKSGIFRCRAKGLQYHPRFRLPKKEADPYLPHRLLEPRSFLLFR